MDLADLAAETSTIYPTQRTPTALLNPGLQAQSGLPGHIPARPRKTTATATAESSGKDLLTGAGPQMRTGMPQRQLAEAAYG